MHPRAELSRTPGLSRTLCLVPTSAEERHLDGLRALVEAGLDVRLCGFGPVAAAARTSQLLAARSPARVLLVGIAGTFDKGRHPLGSAIAPAEVALHGVGAGEGEAFLGPSALGWREPLEGAGPCGERLRLCDPRAASGGLLLTVCAASASRAEADLRRARYPDATAEDMEAFAVAFACALAGVPCRVVRGISNEVGDRAAIQRRLPEALAAACVLARELLAAPEWSSAP